MSHCPLLDVRPLRGRQPAAAADGGDVMMLVREMVLLMLMMLLMWKGPVAPSTECD